MPPKKTVVKSAAQQNRAIKKIKPPGLSKIYDMTLFDALAKMMLRGESITEIKDKLHEHDPGYRDTLTKQNGVSNPDGECRRASDMAKQEGSIDAPAYNYKDLDQRKKILGTGATYNGPISPWAIEMVNKKDPKGNDIFKFNRNGKRVNLKERQKIDLSTDGGIVQGECGECWMCGLMVYYYVTRNYVTGCGECEHIGGIVASFLTGMLASSMRTIQMHNYGTAHAHCNQQKSDTLSMKFNGATWEVDNGGINDIINSIIKGKKPYNSTPHGNEYDPEFLRVYATETSTKDKKKHGLIP